MVSSFSEVYSKSSALVLAAAVALGTNASIAEALDPRIQALTKKLDCASYQLNKTNQRVRLNSQNTIPGAPAAWALLNEGPSRTTIFASNGEKISLRVFSGTMTIFTGDRRFSYAVGLSKKGAAIVHVCR